MCASSNGLRPESAIIGIKEIANQHYNILDKTVKDIFRHMVSLSFHVFAFNMLFAVSRCAAPRL